MRVEQIALQLYTVRRPLADDPAATLRAVADAGFRFVEIAGLAKAARGTFARQLEAASLTAIAAHVGLDELRSDGNGVKAWLEELGCRWIVVPSLPDAERATIDGVRRLAAELNRHAAELAPDGVRLGYHNHAAEFASLEGTTTWDVLLAELDPRVDLELDVYWASVGGREPAALIEEAGSRVRLVHMKDRAARDEVRDAPAGEGILDLAAIVAAADRVGVEWYIAEQDEPSDPIADSATARRNLQALATTPGA